MLPIIVVVIVVAVIIVAIYFVKQKDITKEERQARKAAKQGCADAQLKMGWFALERAKVLIRTPYVDDESRAIKEAYKAADYWKSARDNPNADSSTRMAAENNLSMLRDNASKYKLMNHLI